MNYAKHYNRLIQRARKRSIVRYGEWHHVVPRCMGGFDEKSNLVKLTPEEHYVAHLLLVKMFPGNRRLLHAAMMMGATSSKRVPRTNKVYGWLRRRLSIAMSKRKISKRSRFKMHVAAVNRSKWNHKETTKQKIGLASRGRKMPKAFCLRQSILKTGKRQTVATRLKISEARKLQARHVHNDEQREKIRLSWVRRRKKFGPSGRPSKVAA